MGLLIQAYGRNHLKPQPVGSVAISVGYTKEQNDLIAHVKLVTMTDDQLAYIEEFCAKISTGLDNAVFNAKRQIIQLLDIRGKITFENCERMPKMSDRAPRTASSMACANIAFIK